MRRALVMPLLAFALSSCTNDDGLEPLVGRWGAKGIEIVGTSASFRIELACHSSEIGRAAVVDEDGRFTIVGTVTQSSSPSMIGWAVTVEGRMTGGRLDVTVKVNNATKTYEGLRSGASADWSDGRSCIQ